jgi:excisionase family DNA binding protein
MAVKLADDLLDGADEIARFTGWSKRRVFYLLERKQIPAFKVGNKWCARGSTLTEYIAKLERAQH